MLVTASVCGHASWHCLWTDRSTSNTHFKLKCAQCGRIKHWTPQGEDGILDDLLFTASRTVGMSPTKLVHLFDAIHCGNQPGLQRYGMLMKQLDMVVEGVFKYRQEAVASIVRQHLENSKASGATIAYDGTYSNRNNNSDHVVETFVEWVTLWKYLLHIETMYCSKRIRHSRWKTFSHHVESK